MVGITDMLKKEMHVTSAVTDARYKIIKTYWLNNTYQATTCTYYGWHRGI